MIETAMFDLGWGMARAQKGMITICTPADTSEGVMQPAASFQIAREQDIRALIAACEYALRASSDRPGKP